MLLAGRRTRSAGVGWRVDAAQCLFAGTALVFIGVAAVTTIWISRANLSDPFVLGGATLGSAMDPAGFYFADVILFFEPSPQQIVNHPGLTVTATGALAAKLACLLVGDGDSFVDFWVRHRILLNGILAALANAMLLLSCHPLFRVLRHLMDAASAYVGCAVFLSSVPVLLMVSHFADEAWMLYFTLWSIHFSFVLLDGKASASIGAAMGVCTSLAVLSKWLAAPIVALNVYSLLASRRHNAAAFWKAAGAYALGGVAVAVVLFRKVSLPALISGLQANWDDGRGALSFAQIFSLPYQRPLVLHHALVFGMGVLGVLAMLQAQARTRAKLVPLLATVSVIGLLTVRRPLWHYFFVLHWLFSAAAVCGLTLALRRWVGWRRDLTAVAAGLIVIAAGNAWQYPDLVATYARYRESYRQRAALVREHPAWVPAPWEIPLADLALTRTADALMPFYSGRPLQATLQRQREEEDRQRRFPGALPAGDAAPAVPARHSTCPIDPLH